MNKDELLLRWKSLLERIGSKYSWPVATRWESVSIEFKLLCHLYGKLKRSYHNLDHIASCLKELGPVASLLEDPEAVELALWYHDIVYEIPGRDNEERSASFAQEACRRLNISEDFGEKVKGLILATRHLDGLTGDACYIADIDLVILGSSEEEFLAYEGKIRREYHKVSSSVYAQERALLIAKFLSRRIYRTEYFFDRYEQAARSNLSASLDRRR